MAVCHSFCLFFIFYNIHTIIQSHSYNTFAEASLQARVRFSARHHREVCPTELSSFEEMDRGLGKFNILFHVFTFLSTIKIEQCIYYCGRNIENSTNLFTLPSTNLPGIEHAPPVTGCGHSTIEPWKLYLHTQHSCKETSQPPLHTTTHNNTQQHYTTALGYIKLPMYLLFLWRGT